MQNNQSLSRPLWTGQEIRKNSKYWLDKNEINIEESIEFNKYIIESLNPIDLSTYPDLSFCYKFLENIFNIREENSLLVNGSDGGIREVNLILSKNYQPIILQPTFAMIGIYPANLNNSPIKIKYNLNKNFLSYDYYQLIKEISQSKKPPFLIIATPDSPTGSLLSLDKLKILISEIEKKDGLFLIDGTYSLINGYEYMIEIINIVKSSTNVLFTASFSKSPGLAGARLGFLTGSEIFINKIRSIRPMYEIGAIQAKIFNTVFSNWEMTLKVVGAIKSNKEVLENVLKEYSPKVIETGGNFSLFENTMLLSKKLDKLCYYRKAFNVDPLKKFSRLSTPSKAFLKEFKNSLNLP